MSISPSLKHEMLVRVQAFLSQHVKDLANPAMRGDKAMLAESELYAAIPEQLRRILDRSGPHEIYERLYKGCPTLVDMIYKACREDSSIYNKVLIFWDAMKGHEEMAVGEDEEESLPGEAEDENRIPQRAGASRQSMAIPSEGVHGISEPFEKSRQNGVCEEVEMPAAYYTDSVETPADEPAEQPDPPEEDFVEDAPDEDETEEEV